MINEEEFERRVAYWIGLVIRALEDNIGCAIMMDSNDEQHLQRDHPDLLISMEEADVYRLMYLPEAVLAHYLDPVVPEGYFKTVARADFLLRHGLAQRNARNIALDAIARAMTGTSFYRQR